MSILFQHIKTILRLAIPMSLTGMVNILISFISMIFIARLGIEHAAAAGLAIPTYITVFMSIMGVLYSISILVSHQQAVDGEDSDHQVGTLFKGGLWAAVTLSLPASLLLWNGDKILRLFMQKEQLVEMTVLYFHFSAYSIFPGLVSAAISQFYLGIGNSNFNLISSLLRLPFTLFLAYAFTFGYYGLPDLAIAGVACANLIVQTLYCLLVFLWMASRENLHQYKLFNQITNIPWDAWKKIFIIGVPIGVQLSSELLVLTLLTYLLGYFGPTALAASNIVSQFGLVVLMLVVGLTQSTSVLVSHAYRHQNIELIQGYTRATQIIITCLFVGFALVTYCCYEQMLRIFFSAVALQDGLLNYYASAFFIISIITLYIDSLRNGLSAVLRGLHRPKVAMTIGLACLWLISLPVACFFAFILHWGAIGLKAGFISGFFVAVFLLLYKLRFHYQSIHPIGIKNKEI